MWDCPNCGAKVDGAVDKCWACGGLRPEEETAAPPEDEAGAIATPTDQETPAKPPTGRWTCAKCGTRVEPGFEVCWNCGTSVDGVEDPEFVTADEVKPDDQIEDPFFVIADEVKPDNRDDVEVEPEAETLVCPKCQGEMREGFLPDNAGGRALARLVPAVWVAGRPQPSFWTGTWGGDERHPLRAFRCEDCAYLEFYARD